MIRSDKNASGGDIPAAIEKNSSTQFHKHWLSNYYVPKTVLEVGNRRSLASSYFPSM